MKISARRGFGAEVPVPPIDYVEIDGENAPLRPERFLEHRKPGFETFADPAAHRKKKKAARRLLADGACAAQPPAAFIVSHGAVDRAPVEAMMRTEFLVFGSNHRARERWRHLVHVTPVIMRAVARNEREKHLRRSRNGNSAEHQDE